MKLSNLRVKETSIAAGLAFAVSFAIAGPGHAGACEGTTLANDGGLESAFKQQFEKAEYEAAAGCTITITANPDMERLNGMIGGNPDLPPTAERVPEDPLVVVPYYDIGKHGGTLRMISNAAESGTSDGLSVRHVNMLRIVDDLTSVVPNVAKSWFWNEDYTELTFELRKGHRWSDGAPFTAEDIAFWFNDIIMNEEMFPNRQSRWLFGGQTAHVEVIDPLHAKFVFPIPVPNITNRFAVTWLQPYLPKHFFSEFHIKYNPNANDLAVERGVENWVDLVNIYYNATEWHDAPSPLLKGADTKVMPTLEPYILVDETPTGRHFVANPYFYMVDTAGNQLPYIGEMDERYVPDAEARVLKIINGEVDYKSQSLSLPDFPLLKENEPASDYNVHLASTIGEGVYYAFNTTAKPDELRKVFNDVRFRRAMSVAMNREEIRELVYLGLGEPMQATPAAAGTVGFLSDENLTAYIQYDPAMANALLDEMGLKDSNGDGVREMWSGEPLIIQMLYANAGGPVKIHELVQGYWSDVGVNVSTREVTTEEYRSKGNANELLVTSWRDSQRAGVNISQFTSMLVPPFGNPYQPGTGFEWANWKATDGAEGIEPPEEVKQLYDLAEQFILKPFGSAESDEIGSKIADLHTKNLFKIGVVNGAGTPQIVSKNMGNFLPFSVVSDDYYFAVPFRPQQWYFE